MKSGPACHYSGKMEGVMGIPAKRWLYLFTGSIVFFCIGIVYAWSIFAGMFKDIFPSWTSTALATTFTIVMAFFCLGNFSAGFISKKLSTRAMLAMCAGLIGAGFIGVSLITENTLWLLYLSYGVVGNFGVGITYNIVLSTIARWFPDKIGAASGTLMMCFAFSTLVLGVGANSLSPIFGWRMIFAGLAVLMTLVVAVAAMILKLPENDISIQNTRVPDNRRSFPKSEMTVEEMLKSSAFWLFFIWGILLLVAVYAIMGNVKQCVLELDQTATGIATFSVTLLSICNGFGRMLLGSLYDRLGRIKTMTLDTSLIIVSSILMIAAFQVHSVPLMLLGVVFTGFSYGGVPPTSSAFTVDYFGANNYSMKFGIVTLYIFVGAFGSSLAGIIKDKAGSFRNLFYILILLGIVAFILNLFIGKRRVKD